MKEDVFENLRSIHRWTAEIRNGMNQDEKEESLGEILLSMFSLFKSLNTDIDSISEHFQKETCGETFNQVALLATMSSCFINLTHFLKDNKLSIEEYCEFVDCLTIVAEQASKTYFEDLEGRSSVNEGIIHQINSAFTEIGSLLKLIKK